MNNDTEFLGTNWKKEPAPKLSKTAKASLRRVKIVRKKAFLFLDTHSYSINRLDDVKYCVVVPFNDLEEVEAKNFLMVGDFQQNRDQIKSVGDWSLTADESWESAWRQIELQTLKKLSQ